ncbi:MAG: IS5 family transposase, partial [Bradyrhizobium sp.]|nr:IS5 family transposase [Bradyrhizobium sp.]
RAGLDETLFGEILRQIDAQGLVVRRGTLIDASLIPAAVKPPKPPEEPQPPGPDGREPSKLVHSKRDPDARWTKKGGKRYFGYKAHVGIDQGSAIIRRSTLTDAAVNDTVPADELICGDEQAVYADQAYDKHERRSGLRARGIKPRLMFRPNKHHPLTERQKRFNDAVGKRRAPVEQVFARLKGSYRWARARYLGLVRNQTYLRLICLAMNLKRWAVLSPTGAAA